MNTVPHDFVTVDMRGLKAVLTARAREQRVSVSVVLRNAVAKALALGSLAAVESPGTRAPVPAGALVKVTIRMESGEAARLDEAAKAAGLSRGVFLSGRLDGVTLLSSGERRDHLAALIRASAELSTLSRNVRHLADLLRSSDFSAAREYRGMLDSLAGDIARHLEVSGAVLSGMSPRHRKVRREGRFGRSNKGSI